MLVIFLQTETPQGLYRGERLYPTALMERIRSNDQRQKKDDAKDAKATRSSWAHPKNRMGNHRLNVNGPFKKDTFYKGKRWLVKTCTRNRAGPLDDAPWVNGIQQNVECLIAASNGTQTTFGSPIRDNMNGEIKLTTGVLQLNTQDAVNMVMDTPIINNGSDGKLVLIFINIEKPSKLKPMLHGMSNTTDPDTFMAAHHITLNGERTSDQSTALQEKIYKIQMAIYKKGLWKRTADQHRADSQKGYENSLALLTTEQHRADSQKGYENSLALLTTEQRSANGKKRWSLLTPEQRLANYMKGLGQTKFYCPPPTITENGMHDLAKDDVVFQANYGTGTVKGILRPSSDKHARARVKFDDEQVGTRPVTINSLSCNGKQCQFVKEYKLTPPWPKTEAEASVREFDWGKCSKCGTMGSYNDPENPGKRHQHSRKCRGYFGRQT